MEMCEKKNVKTKKKQNRRLIKIEVITLPHGVIRYHLFIYPVSACFMEAKFNVVIIFYFSSKII